MNKVQKRPLPANSQLGGLFGEGDFLDCYEVRSRRALRAAAEEMMNFPWWVQALLKLRNALVKPFGLETDTTRHDNQIGIFPIISESDEEILAGFDDRHLNFRLAIGRDHECIYLATWVHTHNFGGRLYLGLVMPFHIIIIRHALARIRSD